MSLHHSIQPSTTANCEEVGRMWSLCSGVLGFSPASFCHQLCDFGKGRQPLWDLVSSSV